MILTDKDKIQINSNSFRRQTYEIIADKMFDSSIDLYDDSVVISTRPYRAYNLHENIIRLIESKRLEKRCKCIHKKHISKYSDKCKKRIIL